MKKDKGGGDLEGEKIIELYCQGSESAIIESEKKYGAAIKRLSFGITDSMEDAAECLNDTLMTAWKTVATVKPDNLGSYLFKIARNLSLDMLRKQNTAKWQENMAVALSELEDCIPDKSVCAQAVEGNELSEVIDEWLASIDKDKRQIFMRRYFLMEPVEVLSKKLGVKKNTAASILRRLRKYLKKYLEEKGYSI